MNLRMCMNFAEVVQYSVSWYMEIIAVSSQIHTKHTNSVGKMQVLLDAEMCGMYSYPTTSVQVYQTSQGYFVVTPEKRRRGSNHHHHHRRHSHSRTAVPDASRQLLMSTEEALVYVHGEMQTIRDGEVTHQAVQTNLADVICGGESFRQMGTREVPCSDPLLDTGCLTVFGRFCTYLKHYATATSCPFRCM